MVYDMAILYYINIAILLLIYQYCYYYRNIAITIAKFITVAENKPVGWLLSWLAGQITGWPAGWLTRNPGLKSKQKKT